MANRKGKIIVGSGLVILAGITTALIISSVRKRKITNRIYEKLDDTTLAGAGKTVSAEEAHKFTLGLDPTFWKRKSGSPLPTKLMSDKVARANARYIKSKWGALGDDEPAILNAIKKLDSQGQLSQVAYMYSSPPLNYGSLADDLQKALTKTWGSNKDYLKELNVIINSMPY